MGLCAERPPQGLGPSVRTAGPLPRRFPNKGEQAAASPQGFVPRGVLLGVKETSRESPWSRIKIFICPTFPVRAPLRPLRRLQGLCSFSKKTREASL